MTTPHGITRRRIAILGVSGSGKTTLAKRLSKELGIPHVELDALVHLPNWSEAATPEVRRRIEQVLSSEEGWVIDGNYEAKLGDLRLAIYSQADVVVWLNLPLPLILYRLVGRILVDWGTQRELYNGNRQGLRFAFFSKDSLVAYAVQSHYRRRREYPARFRELGIDVLRFQSPPALDAWLREILGQR